MPTGRFGPADGLSLPKARYTNAAPTPTAAKNMNGGRQPQRPTRNGPMSESRMFPETPPITYTPIAVALRFAGNQEATSVMPGAKIIARNTPDTIWLAIAAG